MYFDYYGYVRECLEMPLYVLVIFFLSIGVIFAILSKKKISREKLIYLPIALVGWGIFLWIVIGQLSYGGIYLVVEKEAAAIQTKGYIEKIAEVGIASFPRMECDYYDNLKYGDPYGYEFTINGIQCTAPTNGSLQVGDYVEVTYLPKSRYILYIDKTEEP